LVLVTFGLVLGYLLHRPAQTSIAYNKQIDSLSSQVSEIKQVMMLSLLQDPSASQRIKAVSYTDDLGNVNLRVIDALLTTLNEDPNVNVRLATLEALVRFSGEPKVREGLVRSINLQESPIMQSAIADVMVKLQEKSSVQSLQKLLSKKDLNKMVKVNIEKSIQKLI
jgi:HEAT repeat protein